MRIALKQNPRIIHAMEDGLHHVLIRKGDMTEENQFLLYPRDAYHNDANLQRRFRPYVSAYPPSHAPPGKVKLSSWAQVGAIFHTSEAERLRNIYEFYVWNTTNFFPQAMQQRGFDTEANHQPYNVLVLRVYKLPHPIIIDEVKDSKYICTCGVPYTILGEDISVEGSVPVLSDDTFKMIASAIREIIVAPLELVSST